MASVGGRSLSRGFPSFGCKFALGSKPMIEITPMASALIQPNFVGAPADLAAQIRGLRRDGGVVCFPSRFVFHCLVLFCGVPSLLPGNQHDSEASFVSHHASISFGGICQRNGFDHWTDLLQGAKGKRGKRALGIYRRASHRSRKRTHTE